ncbi:MAG: hypothetical protein A2020_05240 [Lentisphaerae bacterium GWF2_45_14]|nr:MAG: hypothetical protein A2020_05240 [Lentisphaerae bacterium GWF2_45_14]
MQILKTIRWRLVLPFIFVFLAFLLLSAGYCFGKYRKFGYGYSGKSYLTLYYPLELPIIKNIEKHGDRLKLQISPLIQGPWTVSIDGGRSYTVEGPRPELKLIEGRHEYSYFSCKYPQNFSIKLNYVDAGIYKDAGHSDADVVDIMYSSIPVGDFERYPLKSFVPNYKEEDLAEAARLIKAEINITARDTTEIKIKKLASFILRNLSDKGGIPTKEGAKMIPLKQYLSALSGDLKLWCHNFSEIYVFFANAAGIPSREVSSTGSLDGCRLSGHAFAESYIKEKEQWAFVDPTSYILYMKYPDGTYVNTIDLFSLCIKKTFPGDITCFSWVPETNSIKEFPLSDFDMHSSVAYYFRRDAIFKFPLASPSNIATIKLTADFFKPTPVYSLKDTAEIN